MRLWFIAALIILLNSVYVYGLVINEVMYNPSCHDDACEWLEIFNDQSDEINFSLWKLDGKGFSNSTIQPGEYMVITSTVLGDNSFESLWGNNDSVWNYLDGNYSVVQLSTLSLKNTNNDTVNLTNGTQNDIILYLVSYGANGNGKSLCRNMSSFYECMPTPGKINAGINVSNATANLTDVRLEIYINSAKVNITYTNLFKIFIDNKTCSQLDNVTVEYNITPSISSSFTREVGCESYTNTGTWTPSLPGNYTLCGAITSSTTNNTNTTNDMTCKTIEVTDIPPLSCSLSVNILSPVVVNSTQTLNYDIFVNDSSCNQASHDIVVEYWIEDMFGYYVKERINTTQTMVCSKTINRQWTPDDISGTEGYKIFAKLVSLSCSDVSQSDDENEKIIVVRGTNQQDSALEITSLSGNEVKYGEDVNVNLYIFRNSTDKYSINIWVRKNATKLSEVTTFHAKSKNTKYNLTLPVRIKPNCDSTYEDGTYIVFAEGLDKNSTRNITIKGISSAFCKTVQVSSGSSGGGGSSGSATTAVASHSPMELISYPETVYIGKEFEITIKVNSSVKKPFSIYSYVYKGNNPVSEGGWTGNKKNVTEDLPEIRLKNIIEKGTEPGTYNLRIRLKTDKEEDITKEIYVVQESSNNTNTINDETGKNITSVYQKENKSSVTGLLVSKKSDINKHIVLIYLLSKIKLPRLF